MCEGGDCCRTFSRIILIIVNLFFFLLGLLMLAFGIAMVVAPEKSLFYGDDPTINQDDNNSIIKRIGIFTIVLGGIVALVGSFGFFGACRENRILLFLYLIIVVFILLAEIALIIFAAVVTTTVNDEFMKVVKDEVGKTLIKNYTQDLQIKDGSVVIGDNYESFGYSWAATQLGAKCCGVNGSSDYDNYNASVRTASINGETKTLKYPLSCCKLKDDKKFPPETTDDFANWSGCTSNPPVANSYNEKGCLDAIEVTLIKAAKIAIGIAAAIIGLEILVLVFGFLLYCGLRRYKSVTI